MLLGAHRGSLQKVRTLVTDPNDWPLILVLRLAVVLNRRRANRDLPPVTLSQENGSFRIETDKQWLAQHPLSESALDNEVVQWQSAGLEVRVDQTG